MDRYLRVEDPDGRAWWAVESPEGFALLDGPPWAAGRPTGEVLLDPPVLAPWGGTKIVGIGSNYKDHAAEMGKPLPAVPKLFLKAPSAVIGPGTPIELPPRTTRVDHEAELGVVIGRRCSRVSEADAMQYVFGYTCVNDVTARDFQREDGVFARGKGFDTFCPVGPAIVTGIDPSGLAVGCIVNGMLRQAGNTSGMHFSIPQLIAFVSAVMTLEPGDLIATGTPAGVGPLEAGDNVIVEVDGVGLLHNPVVDRADRAPAAGTNESGAGGGALVGGGGEAA